MIRTEPIPEIGQLVEVRGRHWVVTDVTPSALPPDALARMGTVRWRHGGEISSVTFAADGKTVASASSFQGVCLWDAMTGKDIRRFRGSFVATCVAVSPDGGTLASDQHDWWRLREFRSS